MIDILRDSAFFGAVLTIFAFEVATWINSKSKRLSFFTNPFLLTLVIIITSLVVLGISHAEYMVSAQYISIFSTPATVALAIPLYNRVSEIKQNLPAILGGITLGVVANILTIFMLCKIFGFSHTYYVSLIPKSITTPIAIGLCEEYGGISAITVLCVLISGGIGNVFGAKIVKLYKFKYALSRGLALGTSSHALGTAAAVQIGEMEGATSSLAIATTGVLTVFIAPFFVGWL